MGDLAKPCGTQCILNFIYLNTLGFSEFDVKVKKGFGIYVYASQARPSHTGHLFV